MDRDSRGEYYTTQIREHKNRSDKITVMELFVLAVENIRNKIMIKLARSSCLRYAGCKHFVSALGPSALVWEKVSKILQIYSFVSFYTETTYQLMTIGPRFYKNVIIFLFSRKRQHKLIICC